MSAAAPDPGPPASLLGVIDTQLLLEDDKEAKRGDTDLALVKLNMTLGRFLVLVLKTRGVATEEALE
jgi:hypothetical protein